MKEKGVIYASRDPNNVMSVMSLADIVVYNRVGTPSMIALLLDIPSFCFYDKVAETPDPIIKNYINVLAFDDSEKVLDRIAKILNGEKAPQLTMEHKKLLDPFMDNNGLERFKSVVTDIIVNKKGFSKEQMPENNP